ncbi:DUF6879 family protein [Nocardia sp. CC216A]|uniref:DUF6879 family protein n=1 Tax=unclassified Nocardia TaxID=2637762 RepID=UPI003558CB85
MRLLTDEHFDNLFKQCEREAFHLEVRDSYAVPQESEPFRRFLDGEPTADYGERPWTALVRSMTAKGVDFKRVRVVTEPHSDYQRWLLSITETNVDAGEDIRYVPRHHAVEVPPDDWWLFDDRIVAFNLVDQNWKPAGAAVTTDPRIIEYCEVVRNRLWRLAMPYREYLRQSEAPSEL